MEITEERRTKRGYIENASSGGAQGDEGGFGGREVTVGGLWRERGMVGDHGVVVEPQCDNETLGVGRGVGW